MHQKENGVTWLRNLNLLHRLYIAIDVASGMHYFHDHCETQIRSCSLFYDLAPVNNKGLKWVEFVGKRYLEWFVYFFKTFQHFSNDSFVDYFFKVLLKNSYLLDNFYFQKVFELI